MPQEELGRDRKNRYKDFLRTESDRRMHLEYPARRDRSPPGRLERAGSQLRNELSAAYAKRNPRHVDFRHHHQGCRRYLHLGCRRHRPPGCHHHHRRNFGLVRNRNGRAPDSSGPGENKSGARSTSSALSTSARAVDYTSESAADCMSEPVADYRSGAAKPRRLLSRYAGISRLLRCGGS